MALIGITHHASHACQSLVNNTDLCAESWQFYSSSNLRSAERASASAGGSPAFTQGFG